MQHGNMSVIFICKTFEPYKSQICNRQVCHVTYHIIRGVSFIMARSSAVMQPAGHSTTVCDAHVSYKCNSLYFHVTGL